MGDRRLRYRMTSRGVRRQRIAGRTDTEQQKAAPIGAGITLSDINSSGLLIRGFRVRVRGGARLIKAVLFAKTMGDRRADPGLSFTDLAAIAASTLVLLA